MILSPSGSLVFCSGDRLELICKVTNPESTLLDWTITPTLIMGSSLHRTVDVMAPSHLASSQRMINSTNFTFLRISAQDELSLVSRLLISHITTGLNGTVVNCTDSVVTMETASAVILVLSRLNDGTSCTVYCNEFQSHLRVLYYPT